MANVIVRRTRLKHIALGIFASLVAASSAVYAQSLGGIDRGHLGSNSQVHQFKPEDVVVKVGKHHIDARKSITHGGIAVTYDTGTGYCLGNGKCDLILTNYHVAERVGSPLKVSGVKILQTYEATSPQDTGAIWVQTAQGISVKLVPVRDIAILRLARSLTGKESIRLSFGQLHEGDNVRVYGFPGGKNLETISATYLGETADGMIVFKARPDDEKFLIPGLSGSLVVNEKNEAVGLVTYGGNSVVEAVPVWSLANFIKKVQPDEFSEIFSSPDEGMLHQPSNSQTVQVKGMEESETSADEVSLGAGMNPPPALPEDYLSYDLDKATAFLPPLSSTIHNRVIEPPNVITLRKNAEEMAGKINDLIAVGSQRSTGGREPETAVQYKLRMLSGQQTFTMSGKELPQLPCPKENGVSFGSGWSDFPTMVGNNLKLRIQQVDDLAVKGWGTVKVFRYEGSPEDKVASINYCTNYGFNIHTEKLISVAVRGEVWTDEDLNILRITQELLTPPSMGWVEFRSSVMYGWLEFPKGGRELVPTNMMTRTETTDDHQIYFSICRFTDYHQFAVEVVLGGQHSRTPLN